MFPVVGIPSPVCYPEDPTLPPTPPPTLPPDEPIDDTNYRLPYAFLPTLYEIHFRPDIYTTDPDTGEIDPSQFSFDGTVVMHMTCDNETGKTMVKTLTGKVTIDELF